jgi:hypothetical protein
LDDFYIKGKGIISEMECEWVLEFPIRCWDTKPILFWAVLTSPWTVHSDPLETQALAFGWSLHLHQAALALGNRMGQTQRGEEGNTLGTKNLKRF